MTVEVPDSKTFPRAVAALAWRGVVRGDFPMSRREAAVLWFLAVGAAGGALVLTPFFQVSHWFKARRAA